MRYTLLILTLALFSCGSKPVKKHPPKEIKRDTTIIHVWNNGVGMDVVCIKITIDSTQANIDSTTDKVKYKDINDTVYFVQIPGDTVRDGNKKIVLDSLGKPKLSQPQWLPLNKKILLQDYNKNVFGK